LKQRCRRSKLFFCRYTPIRIRPAVIYHCGAPGDITAGDIIIESGVRLGPGQVAASNTITIEAELKALGLPVDTALLRDNLDNLEEVFSSALCNYDILLTCGGVLDGDKDLTLRAMQRCGVRQLFHRVRIGPGKGISMALAGDTLIFNLPGGPPSNHMAFRQLALPGHPQASRLGQPVSGANHRPSHRNRQRPRRLDAIYLRKGRLP
jgi:molybdenum cofactor synthesis domain-containing protein